METSATLLSIGLFILIAGIRIKKYDNKIEKLYPSLKKEWLDAAALQLGLKRKKLWIFKESDAKLKKRLKVFVNLRGLRGTRLNINV